MGILRYIQKHRSNTKTQKWLDMSDERFNELLSILFSPVNMPTTFCYKGKWYRVDECDEPE